MNTNIPRDSNDEEVNLSLISEKIGDFFQTINFLIFKSIRFLIKNVIALLVLFALGAGLGFLMDNSAKVYDHQIIVKPNFSSSDYLYAKVELLASKIKERDTLFLASIGIEEPAKLSKISIEPIIDVYQFVNNNEQRFQLLKLMADESDIKKIVEETTTSKNYQYHKISFSTKKLTNYKKTIDPIMNYLNNSVFFTQVQNESRKNLELKIKANDLLISQIDAFLNGLSASGNKGEKLVYYSENSQLNDVIKTKEELVREQGYLRIDKLSSDKIIKNISAIVNVENTKSVNGKLKLILPLLFILIYIAGYFFKRFYKKQSIKFQQ